MTRLRRVSCHTGVQCVRSRCVRAREWGGARGAGHGRAAGVRRARGGAGSEQLSGYIDSTRHVAAVLVHPLSPRSAHVAAVNATAAALAVRSRHAEIMTFGPFAGEEGSARSLVPERVLRIVSRYWEVTGSAPAARPRSSSPHEILLTSPFGLL